VKDWAAERVGIVGSGDHAGRFVQVTEERAGFHIWLLTRHPANGPSEGWDVWAEDEAHVDAWLHEMGVDWEPAG